MSNYFASVQISAGSAWDTLQILDRQARKDSHKVAAFAQGAYTLLTSDAARKHYRLVGHLVGIIGAVAYALYLTALEASDRYVASCQDDPGFDSADLPEVVGLWEPVKVTPKATSVATLKLLKATPAPIALLCAAPETPKVSMKAKAGRPQGAKDRKPRRSKKSA